MNQYRYKKLLQDSKIFSELDQKKNQWNYIFQQDGATCHLTPLVMRYINRKARVLNGWPPNSPDLSPIENLWAIMKERLNRLTTKPKNKNELKKLIQHVYDSISIETINNLVNTFEYRLKMCKDNGGKTIAHFIRKRYHEIPKEYVVQEDKCPLFLNPDLYLQIYLENLKTPHRWKSIAERIGDNQINNIIVKNKALEIERKIKEFKKHNKIMKKIPFELESIIEYLRNNENEEEYVEFEEEEEEKEEKEENCTDDEIMNP